MAERLDRQLLLEQVTDLFVDRLVAELANRIERRLEQLGSARAPAVGPRGYDIKQAAERLGISQTKMKELLVSGEVPSVKVGRRRLIAASAIARLLDGAEPVDPQIRGPIEPSGVVRGRPRAV